MDQIESFYWKLLLVWLGCHLLILGSEAAATAASLATTTTTTSAVTTTSIDPGKAFLRRRCRTFDHLVPRNSPAVQFDSDLFNSTTTGGIIPSRGMLAILDPVVGYTQDHCHVCPGMDLSTFKEFSNTVTKPSPANTHAVIFMESYAMSDSMISIAAGLIMAGSRVTFIVDNDLPSDHTWIVQALTERLPCRRQFFATNMLLFKRLLGISRKLKQCPEEQLDPTKNSIGDYILCKFQNAMPTTTALITQLHSIGNPSVLITDATSIAGILVAEKQLMPAIVLVENGNRFLQHILGSPENSMDRYSRWNPIYWYTAFTIALHNTLRSMDMTSAFVQLNRIRVDHGMRRIRRMSDLWLGSIVLVTDPIVANVWRVTLPYLLIMPQPLLPPCIACTEILSSQQSEMINTTITTTTTTTPPIITTLTPTTTSIPSVVVSVPFVDDADGRRNSRRLYNGIEMARRSIRDIVLSHNDNHDDDDAEVCASHQLPPLLPRRDCRMREDAFQLIPVRSILGNGAGLFSSLPPDYVTSEENNLLDCLSRHQPKVFVTVCNAANAWVQTLGIPTLCLVPKWTAEQIATQFLKLWNNGKNGLLMKNDTLNQKEDALVWTVDLIESVGRLNTDQGLIWKNGRELSWYMLVFLEAKGFVKFDDNTFTHERSLLELLLICFAWLILGMSVLSIAFKETASIQKFRQRWFNQHRNDQSLSILVFAHDFWFRLHDLDMLTALWTGWASDQLSRLDELLKTSSSSSSKGQAAGGVEQSDHQTRRKRNASKKRH